MAYRISRKAEEDILDIYLAGIDRFGIAQAERYHTGLEGVFEIIARFPLVARQRHEISPPVRVHPYEAHIVVYLVDVQGVLILRVRHGREDWFDDPTGIREAR
jgi:toxin ParE1/3/4